jgi:RNA polymerase sigma-70 factor (ECF subfamily)
MGDVTSPSQGAIRNEQTQQLREALDSMDAIDREVLALRHFEQLSNKEVAEVLSLGKTAASNRYVRALERLKLIMDETLGNEGSAT